MNPTAKMSESELLAAVDHLEKRDGTNGKKGRATLDYVRQRIYEKLRIVDLEQAIKNNQPNFIFNGFCVLLLPPFFSATTKEVTLPLS
jgi:hypothetical protein